ncbi:MAG: sulfurtransferase [Acidobacteria bacterium]|nr:sulfurtransferase [Acidobacteriota bacterium]
MRILPIAALCVMLPAAMPAATCGGHGTRESMFVSTEWLAAHLRDPKLVILALGSSAAEFEEGHIPGSIYFEYRDSNRETSAAGLRVELPPADVLARTFARYGVSSDSHVVLYYLKDMWTQTGRVYMTLDAMGLGAQTSLLDGALPAWKAEGRPLATGAAPPPAPGRLEPCRRDDVIADLEFVKSHLSTPGVRILDARDPKVYRGEVERPGFRAGHIAGAGNIYQGALLDDRGKLKPVPELEKMFRDAGVRPGDRVVTYCFIGQQASALYTVARYLGYDARLYDGSMDEWSKHPELPVENPSKAQ